MAAYTPICRYLFDEATTGTGPTDILDDEGTHDVPLDYGTADAEWNSYGLAFLDTAGTAIGTIEDMSTAGSIGQLLDGETEASVIIKMKARNGHANYHRVFIISRSTSNGELGVTLGSGGNMELRWGWDYSGGFQRYVLTGFAGRDEVWCFVLDSTQATAADRCKFYIDGSLQTPSVASIPGSIALNSNNSDQDFCIGNRPNLARETEIDLAYFEIGTGQLTTDQIDDIGTALASDDNQDWQTAASSVIAGTAAGTCTVAGDITGVGALAGTSAGAATVTGTLEQPGGAVAGTAAGVAIVTGVVTGTGAITGLAAGAATAVALIVGTGAIAGTSPGVATVAGTLVGTGAIAGTSPGVATVTGILTGTGALSGTSPGVATVTGILTGTGAIVGTSPGVATVAGTLVSDGVIVGTAAGAATVTGTLVGTGAVAGLAAGAATVTGTLEPLGNEVAGLAAGAAVLSGTLVGTGAIAGTSPGVATVAGTLVGTGAIAGTSPGVATVAGTLVGTGAITSLAAGSATASGTLEQPGGAITGVSAGVATVAGVLVGTGAVVGLAAGAATVTGTLVPLAGATVIGVSNGVAVVVGTLFGKGSIAGSCPTPAEELTAESIAEAVWSQTLAGYTTPGEAGNCLRKLCAVNFNRLEVDIPSQQLVLYDDDGVTVMARWNLQTTGGELVATAVGVQTKRVPA